MGCFRCAGSTDSVAPFEAFDTVGCYCVVLFADSDIAGSYSADQVDAGIADSCFVVRPEAGDTAAGSCYVAVLQAGDTAAVAAGGYPDEVDQDEQCRNWAGVNRLAL